MSLFQQSGDGSSPPVEPITASAYLTKLHKYLQANASRLSPSAPPPGRSAFGTGTGTAGTILQQSYTLLTLGLDPNSAPLSRSLKVPLTLGFGTPSSLPTNTGSKSRLPSSTPIRPLLLRLPPDRLLYLLLRWQSLPQNLPHVGRTDVPIEEGVPVAARGARLDDRGAGLGIEGDVRSVRSWVGSMRSVSMGSLVGKEGGRGWFGGRKEEVNEDQILLALYSMFTLLPALLIHPPFVSEPPILELIEAGGYTQLGGIDVRVPLDVLRNLSILELEGYDPRALLIPHNLNMRSLTVKDVQDGDDWIEELLTLDTEPSSHLNESDNSTPDDDHDDDVSTPEVEKKARFPNLRHLSLMRTNLLSLPTLPLSSLTHLDLSHNLLNSIPSSLANLTSLISLNLSNNVITSVRSAETFLPSIVSLNLSSNRIDCLVGLDRISSLQRVDVRRNELLEVGEVGRLAVLPRIKEVWCSGNGFDIAGEDEWRVELGAAFREEGREVIVDDNDFSWSENRRIDALLASRGRTAGAGGGGRVWNNQANNHHHPHPHSHQLQLEGNDRNTKATSVANEHVVTRATPSTLRGDATPFVPPAISGEGQEQGRKSFEDRTELPDHSRQSSTRSQLGPSTLTSISKAGAGPGPSGFASPASVSASASSAAVAKKKGRRRVIHLDSSESVNTATASGDLDAALALGSASGSRLGSGLGSVRSLSGIEGKGSVRGGAGGGGGSVRLPGKVVEEVEAENEDAGSAAKATPSSNNGIPPFDGTQSKPKSTREDDIDTPPVSGDGAQGANANLNGNSSSSIMERDAKQNRNGIASAGAAADENGNGNQIKQGSDESNGVPDPPISVKVVSSKRKNNRKALKKDTFDPIL
ncbi:hypothetical protein IAT40_006022 [Kwoniella sp. CBS 6097]